MSGHVNWKIGYSSCLDNSCRC